MYRNILIAADGSDLSQRAVGHGLALALSVGAPVTVVTVTEELAFTLDLARGEIQGRKAQEEYERIAENSAGNVLATAAEEALFLGVDCDIHHVRGRPPADGILEAAAESRSDLIVMGTHGRRAVRRALLGSVAIEVVTRAQIPVLIVR